MDGLEIKRNLLECCHFIKNLTKKGNKGFFESFFREIFPTFALL